jgi:putative peptide zinc metalloprotease protein
VSAREAPVPASGDAVGRLRPDLHIFPFDAAPAGGPRYLVELADRSYVVTPTIFEVLCALAEHPRTIGELAEGLERRTGRRVPDATLQEVVHRTLPRAFFAESCSPPRRTPLSLKGTLLPEKVVTRAAHHLAWIFDRRLVLAALAAFGLVTAATLGQAADAVLVPLTGADLVVLYLCCLLSTLVHEFGHAAACARYGCPPGVIGVGLYLVFPVLFTDVTRAWRLSPRQRAVVDMGGLYFQTVLMAGLGLCSLLTSNLVVLRLQWVTLFTMLHTLNPVFKMDGYWLFSDLTGLPNLHRRMREGMRERLRGPETTASEDEKAPQGRFLTLYLVIVALYAAFLGRFLIRAFPEKVLHYPHAAAAELHVLVSAWSQAAYWQVAKITGNLVALSVWPIGISLLVVVIAQAVVGLKDRKFDANTPTSGPA